MKKNKIFYFDDDLIENTIAKTCGATKVTSVYFKDNLKEFRNSLFFIRGVTKNKYIKIFKTLNINYFYIDTGYFGNLNSYYHENTIFKKSIHRIVYNSMQMNKIVKRDDSRYQEILKHIQNDFGVSEKSILRSWKTNGKKILICPPSEKVGAVFGLNSIEEWIKKTKTEIEKYSDREIIIRKKPEQRSQRVRFDTIQAALDKDIFILVTYNSIAATEAVIHGIPALTLGDNAAQSVSIHSIKNIESPIYPDRQLWLNNLTYEQFHVSEMANGIAWKCIKQNL